MTILDKITAKTREEVARRRELVPTSAIIKQMAYAGKPRGFLAALSGGPPIRLIAEVKKASPSKGVIREDFDPVAIAKAYESAGASALSVLTDEPFFQGSLGYLRDVRAAVRLPVLRKDFLIDPYQVYEARAHGADAVLLIAECLDDAMLGTLYRLAVDLGMTPLVELHDPTNLDRVVAIGAKLIGINNRDLATFETDIEQTVRLIERIPADCLVVAESGIHTREQVERLETTGVAAMLVGESLMREKDVATAAARLLGKALEPGSGSVP